MVIKDSGNEVVVKLSKKINKEELAKALNITVEELEQIIKSKKITEEIKKIICDLSLKGKSIKEISEMVNYSRETIRKVLIDNKLYIPRTKSKISEKEIKLINKMYEKDGKKYYRLNVIVDKVYSILEIK